MTNQKNYRLLRFLQFVLSLLGWLCIAAGVIAGLGLTGLSVLSGDVSAVAVTFATSLGIAFGLLTLGISYLIAGQMIEVFVDIASNSQRTVQLLEHQIKNWPTLTPAAPIMPAVRMAEIPPAPNNP